MPRPTFVLSAAPTTRPTERVEAGTPAILGAFPKAHPPNRLGLARWLTSPQHPLTARVIVNRYWAQLFGRGIVATPADFGSQGRLPTHPLLLDYLATTFVASGWDLKAFQKQSCCRPPIASRRSPTPRRASAMPTTTGSRAGRPTGCRPSRSATKRSPPAGCWCRQIGGPSVYPYQPAGLWEALATRNATTYDEGKGDDLHRRSLYTFWKRSSPPPAAISFDAAERLVCTVNRQRTSTPLQALVLLNDPQFVEAARVLGRADAAATAARRRRRGITIALSRASPAGRPPTRARRGRRALSRRAGGVPQGQGRGGEAAEGRRVEGAGGGSMPPNSPPPPSSPRRS